MARNVAANLGNWTQPIFLQTLLGDDANAAAIIAHLNKLNVNTDACTQLADTATATYYAVLQAQGELYLALADTEIYADIAEETFIKHWDLWQSNDIIFFDTNLPANILLQAIHRARAANLKLCIDPVSIIKAKKLPADLTGVYLLKPNLFEAESLVGSDLKNSQDCIQAGYILLKKGVQNIVMSLGAEGYLLINETEEKYCPSLQSDVIKDSNGAGDAFFAGILYALQQGASLCEACEWGEFAANVTLQSHENVVAFSYL